MSRFLVSKGRQRKCVNRARESIEATSTDLGVVGHVEHESVSLQSLDLHRCFKVLVNVHRIHRNVGIRFV